MKSSSPPRKLIILGGRGNGTVVASTVEDLNDVTPTYRILGFVNDGAEREINGYPCLGPLSRETVRRYLADPDVDFFWSLVSVKLGRNFVSRLDELELPIERFATIVHPTAVVSRSATLGRGVAVQPFVNIGPNARVGNHVHIFAQAMIGHDSELEDFSYVANNACIGAHVHVRKGAYVGTNATTIENVELGRWSVTGLGAVVIRSVPAFAKVVGNPARQIGET